ncbi:MAG: hypothetical protein AAGH41_00495 [Pseudomonadota bacterium]
MEPIDWFANWPEAPFNETYWGSPFSNAIIVFVLASLLWLAPFWLFLFGSMLFSWVDQKQRLARVLLFFAPGAFLISFAFLLDLLPEWEFEEVTAGWVFCFTLALPVSVLVGSTIASILIAWRSPEVTS